MKWPIIFLTVVITYSTSIRASESADQSVSETDKYDCGVRALLFLCRLDGQQTDLASLAKSLPIPSANGYSMRDLRKEASKHGIYLRGVKLRRGEGPSEPSIIYFGDGGHGHFVVVRPVGHTGKLVQVLDPNLAPVVMDRENLQRMPRWTGLALVPDPPHWPRRIAIAVVIASGIGLGGLIWRQRSRRRVVWVS